MSEAWILFKVQFRSRYSLKELSGVHGRDLKDSAKRLGMLLIILLGFGSILFMYCMMLVNLLKAAIAFQYPELIMGIVVLFSTVICTVFGIFIIMSNIYLAKDTELLYSLPVRSKSVFLSKFMLVYLSETIISLIFMVPFLIIYATMVEGMGIAFYLKGLYVSLLMPAIPLLVALLLDSLMMLIIGRMKRRELFTTVGTFVLMGAVIIGQFLLNMSIASSASAGGEFFADLLSASLQKINSIIVPPVSWAAYGIVGGFYESMLGLALFTITVVIFFIIVYYAAGGIYRRAARYNLESVKRHKKADKRNLSGQYQSPVKAIFKKEWKLLLRSTIYATNSLTGAIMALFLFIIPAFSDQNNEFSTIASSLGNWVMVLLLGGVIALFSAMNMGATTVVSREGKAFWLVKSLPVSYRQQTLAKLLFGISIPLIWGLPIAVAFMVVFDVSVLVATLGFVLGMAISAAITAAGMIFDFIRPKLVWTNEAEAIKQNMNGFFAMVLDAVIVGVLGVLVYLLIAYTALEIWAVCALTSAVTVAFTIISIAALLRIGEKSLDKLDA